MLIDFDPGRRGKHRYPIAVPAGVRAGVVPETLCCISNGEGPTVVLTGGVHGDEYEAQIVPSATIWRTARKSGSSE